MRAVVWMKKHPTDVQRESPILSSNVIFSKSLTRISTRTCQLPSAWQIGPIRIKVKFERGSPASEPSQNWHIASQYPPAGAPLQGGKPIVLRYYGELRYDEIAQQLGLQSDYVAALLFRAKQELRRKLGHGSE